MLGASLLVLAFAPPLAGPVGSLRFETGRHTASVRGVARDPVSGDWITVGFDKAVRRWHDGKPAGPPLRFDTGTLANGQFASCDVSAKGLLAVGDYDLTGPSVWIYDLKKGAGGTVMRLRQDRRGDVNAASTFTSVAFSGDGSLVAAGTNSGTVLLWNAASGRPAGSKKVTASTSFGVFGLAFQGSRLAYAASNNLASGTEGFVGILDASKGLAPVAEVKLDHRVACLDWHDPKAVAIGGAKGSLDLWEPGAASTSPLKTGLDDPRQFVFSVARTADGKTTVAGTILGALLVYRNGATSPETTHPKTTNIAVRSLKLTPDGQTLLVAHDDGEVYQTSVAGGKALTLSPASPKITDVRWTTEPGSLRWKSDGAAKGFDLKQSLPEARGEALPAAGRQLGGASLAVANGKVAIAGVSDWTSLTEPSYVDDAIFLDADHILTATPQGLHIHERILALKNVTVDGGRPTSLARSPDGSKVAVGFADGLVRVYSAKGLAGGEAMVSLFAGGGEWVAWQEKTGLYDSSVGGDSIFGFQVNRGETELATFVPAVMKEKEYRKPGLTASLFGGAAAPPLPAPPSVPLETAITEVPAFAVVGVEGARQTDGGWEVDGDTATVKVRVQNRTGGQKVSVRIGHGTSRDVPGLLDVPNPNGSEKSCTVSGLQPGPNLVRVYLGGEPLPGSEFTIVSKKAGPEVAERIVVLSIGVGEYATPEMAERNLRFATKDAEGFVETVRACALGETVVKLIKDKEATRAGILGAIKWLQTTARPGDRVMLFIASHGVRTDEATYITPSDYALANPKGTGIAWPMLTSELTKVSGKSLVLFTDNCRSGAAVASVRDNMAKAVASATLEMRGLVADMSVFAACDASQESFESATLGHGLFTYALLKGMRGEIPGQANPTSGIVNVDALKASLPDYLKDLSKGGPQQTPRIMVPDWPIPVSKKPAKGG